MQVFLRRYLQKSIQRFFNKLRHLFSQKFLQDTSDFFPWIFYRKFCMNSFRNFLFLFVSNSQWYLSRNLYRRFGGFLRYFYRDFSRNMFFSLGSIHFLTQGFPKGFLLRNFCNNLFVNISIDYFSFLKKSQKELLEESLEYFILFNLSGHYDPNRYSVSPLRKPGRQLMQKEG